MGSCCWSRFLALLEVLGLGVLWGCSGVRVDGAVTLRLRSNRRGCSCESHLAQFCSLACRTFHEQREVLKWPEMLDWTP